MVKTSPGRGAALDSAIGGTLGRQMANAARSQSRSVRSTMAAERNPSGNITRDRAGRVAHHVPIGHDQAGRFVDGHQGAGAIGRAVAFGHDHPHHGGMRARERWRGRKAGCARAVEAAPIASTAREAVSRRVGPGW